MHDPPIPRDGWYVGVFHFVPESLENFCHIDIRVCHRKLIHQRKVCESQEVSTTILRAAFLQSEAHSILPLSS